MDGTAAPLSGGPVVTQIVTHGADSLEAGDLDHGGTSRISWVVSLALTGLGGMSVWAVGSVHARASCDHPSWRARRMLGMSGLRFLHGDLEVLRVLMARRRVGDVPGARRDKHRVVLVVGGGGMRGAYVAGMLRGLDRAGLRAGFDEVFGASSGAFSGAAFLTGQAEEGAACFPEDLAGRAFINLARLGTGRPVLSLDYLIEKVLGRRKPLLWDALGASPAPLRIVATDTADLTAHTLTPDTVEQWRQAVRASACIPLLAGRPIAFGGRYWIDGSVAEPLAVARAVRGGATHVLALLCRGPAELHPRPDTGSSRWATVLDRMAPGLGTLAQGSRRYGNDLQVIKATAHRIRESPVLAALTPARSAGVTGLCRDRVALHAAVEIGERTVSTALEHCVTAGRSA